MLMKQEWKGMKGYLPKLDIYGAHRQSNKLQSSDLEHK
jgi:hypothetical protein